MTRTKKLALETFDDVTIDGCGEALVFKLIACRTTKAGTFERYELQLKACRYSVRKLAQQIADMQERDRARIAEETARLSRELAPLVKT